MDIKILFLQRSNLQNFGSQCPLLGSCTNAKALLQHLLNHSNLDN
jgi:hypothetical protein